MRQVKRLSQNNNLKYLIMEQVKKPKRGILITSLMIIAMIVFVIEIVIGVGSLVFSETISSILGAASISSVFSTILRLVSGALGIYGCINVWKLQKIGLFLFLLALAISLTANFLAWGSINLYITVIYGIWSLMLLMNFKKFS